jgi:hypothetical protein
MYVMRHDGMTLALTQHAFPFSLSGWAVADMHTCPAGQCSFAFMASFVTYTWCASSRKRVVLVVQIDRLALLLANHMFYLFFSTSCQDKRDLENDTMSMIFNKKKTERKGRHVCTTSTLAQLMRSLVRGVWESGTLWKSPEH